MAHLFVPLVAGPANEPAKNLPLSAAQAAVDFKNMAKAAPHAHAPKVSLQREGDKVTRIEITCSCGQVIDLDCIY